MSNRIVKRELVYCENCHKFCTIDTWINNGMYFFDVVETAGFKRKSYTKQHASISENRFTPGNYPHYEGVCDSCAKELKNAIFVGTKHPIGQYIKAVEMLDAGLNQIEEDIKYDIQNNLSLDLLDKIYHNGLESLKNIKPNGKKQKRKAVEKFLGRAQWFIQEYISIQVEQMAEYKEVMDYYENARAQAQKFLEKCDVELNLYFSAIDFDYCDEFDYVVPNTTMPVQYRDVEMERKRKKILSNYYIQELKKKLLQTDKEEKCHFFKGPVCMSKNEMLRIINNERLLNCRWKIHSYFDDFNMSLVNNVLKLNPWGVDE